MRWVNRSEFLRAYGNRSASDVAPKWYAVEESVWVRQVDDTAGIDVEASVGLGVWVSEDGEDAAVSAGFRDDRGRMHVEHLHGEGGVRWIRDYVLRLTEEHQVRAVAMSNLGASRDVADELEDAGVTVLRVSQADVSAACSRHRSELRAGSWWHRINTEVTKAARGCWLGEVWWRVQVAAAGWVDCWVGRSDVGWLGFRSCAGPGAGEEVQGPMTTTQEASQ